MIRIFAALVSAITFFAALPAVAQTTSWVQIEARPTLQEAQERARSFGANLPDVVGYRLNTGWYALALGPYSRSGAEARLDQLRGTGLIPSDSYISDGRGYGGQFWPLGQDAAVRPDPDTLEAAEPQAPAAATEALVDETPAQARRSEGLLSRDERITLQAALQWEGYYNAALNGAIGPGTRRAMAAYQAATGADPTGVLTSAQRTDLVAAYRVALDQLGMEQLRDDAAGITLQMPMGLVEADSPLSPFSRYKAENDSGVTVLLLSQSGDEAALAGLYDLMQTLEVVPLNGRRERNRRSFVLTGQNDAIESYTYAAVADGAIKGFTVTWRPEQRRLMTRVTQLMRESFTTTPGVILPDTAGREDQSIDLFAGLEIRRPALALTGFYVDDSGAVLTSGALSQCARITIGEDEQATIAAEDTSLGLTLLRPTNALAPLAIADFRTDAPRLQSEIAAAGYSYGGVLNLPALTFGRLTDLRGLQGEDGVSRLDLATLPGDAGGPVFDDAGSVIGVLLPRETGARQLPGDVSFAASAAAVTDFLQESGITPRQDQPTGPLAPEDLGLMAADMTVLISCWN